LRSEANSLDRERERERERERFGRWFTTPESDKINASFFILTFPKFNESSVVPSPSLSQCDAVNIFPHSKSFYVISKILIKCIIWPPHGSKLN
jgi:hypothetical protein